MSTYPGEDPQRPADDEPTEQLPQEPTTPPAEPPTDPASPESETELTQPVGYWERQAAEQARQQPQQGDPDPSAAQGGDQGGAVFNPTTAQPSAGWDQGGGTQPYEQNPYPPYAQPGQPYGQPAYGAPYQQPYAQPGYQAGYPPAYGYPPPAGQSGPPGAHPGYPPYAAFAPHRPDHPQSTLALILGICGLVFGFACGLGFLASPFAWALGRNAVKEIRASHGRLGGEGAAKAGMVTGIIGTILLIIGVVALIGFAVLVAVSDTSSGSSI